MADEIDPKGQEQPDEELSAAAEPTAESAGAAAEPEAAAEPAPMAG